MKKCRKSDYMNIIYVKLSRRKYFNKFTGFLVDSAQQIRISSHRHVHETSFPRFAYAPFAMLYSNILTCDEGAQNATKRRSTLSARQVLTTVK